jgi:hypothetical protein
VVLRGHRPQTVVAPNGPESTAMKPQEPAPDCEVEITFKMTEEGGRKGPAHLPAYRPDFLFQFSPQYAGAHFVSDDRWVAPGETIRASIFFRWPELVLPNIKTVIHLKSKRAHEP